MARLRGYGRRAAAHVADHLIDQLDIAEFKDKLVKSISGGQRRRVDLAASLVVQPKLLVLDEPTTGLDPRSRQSVWSAIRELVTEGVTVLLTTQYLEEADELADNVVVMDHGRAVASGTPPELRAQIGDHRVDVVVADPADVDRVVEALGSSFVLTLDRARRTVSVPAPNEAVELALVAQELKQAAIHVDEISLRRPTLDDAFMALTGEPPTREAEPRDDSVGALS
jgi:ABC-type multidrug transport system ATPase subunit